MILGRRTPGTDAASTGDVEVAELVAGKGRPTPKRADARKTRRSPAPANRKEAAARQREKAREQRKLARQALVTGDERHLPPRDAGPERRLARDVVDSRFTVGQVLFGLIFAALILSFIKNKILNDVTTFGALIALTVMVVDGQRTGRRAKQAVLAKYGDAEIRGISSYAFMRALLPRRFRKPPPKVKRGEQIF